MPSTTKKKHKRPLGETKREYSPAMPKSQRPPIGTFEEWLESVTTEAQAELMGDHPLPSDSSCCQGAAAAAGCCREGDKKDDRAACAAREQILVEPSLLSDDELASAIDRLKVHQMVRAQRRLDEINAEVEAACQAQRESCPDCASDGRHTTEELPDPILEGPGFRIYSLDSRACSLEGLLDSLMASVDQCQPVADDADDNDAPSGCCMEGLRDEEADQLPDILHGLFLFDDNIYQEGFISRDDIYCSAEEAREARDTRGAL